VSLKFKLALVSLLDGQTLRSKVGCCVVTKRQLQQQRMVGRRLLPEAAGARVNDASHCP